MKIRAGFVSNSSSSSFVIIGKSINERDLTEKDFKDMRIFCDTGLCGNEGTYGDTINYDQFVKLKGHSFDFYEVFKVFEDSKPITKDDIPENGAELILDTWDYHFDADYIKEMAERDWS